MEVLKQVEPARHATNDLGAVGERRARMDLVEAKRVSIRHRPTRAPPNCPGVPSALAAVPQAGTTLASMLPPLLRHVATAPGNRRRVATVTSLLLLILDTGLGAQQAAAPLPPPARASGVALRDLDAATTNVDWEEVRVADLPLLARLPALRRLQINPNTDDAGGWPKVTPDDLAPLLALPALETLTLPYCAPLSVAHLQRLAGCKRLAKLMCINEAFLLDAAIGAAFAEFPALRTLELSVIRVTAEGLGALAKVERLERLELSGCRGLDAAGMAAVAGISQLHSLDLSSVGRPDMIAAMRGGGAPPSWALDVPTMKLLAKMPKLRELALRECVLAPHLLAELPLQLSSLQLQGWQIDVTAIGDLRRLAGLRALELWPSGPTAEEWPRVAAAAAGLLGSLHLDRSKLDSHP